VKDYLVRYALGLAVLLVLVGHAGNFYEIGVIDRLDAIVYDALVRLNPPQNPDRRIVIVDIDEKSLAEVGRWPWGRDRLASLLDKLFDRYGVALVGFDVVFAEPDDSSGLRSLDALANRQLRDNPAYLAALRDLRPQLDHDARFAAAIKGRPVVLGYYLSSRTTGSDSGELPPATLPAGSFRGRRVAFTHWNWYGANLAQFQRNAVAAGHINPIVDNDGVHRRVPLLVEYGGQYYEALSLAMVRTLLGSPPVLPGYPDDELLSVRRDSVMEWLDLPTAQGTVRIPVDENAAALIPYRGPQGSFVYLSAADVLAERVPAQQLKNSLVLVGTTAPALMDQRATPVGAAYPGVEIHANLIAGMLDGRLKHQPGYLLGANLLLLALSGAVMVFLLPRLSPLRASLVALLVWLLLIAVNLVLWYQADLVLPLAGGLIMVAVLYAINMSWGYFVESKTRRQFAGLFGQYVPPELVDEMARNPGSYSMEGRKAELTVFFADIRGFTSISEILPADQLAELMNEYLDAMTAVIRRQRGTLDKYIGDAIMAFWGAPVDDPHHARHAVLSALEMQAELARLNPRLLARGWPELKIGVGINTGSMTVGDMGSRARKAYTVIGDAVNLASRLEGITKQYGVGIIVGERTRQMLDKEVVFRELDRVRVKGKEDPVAIYEPIGLEGEIDKDLQEELRWWHQALRAYRAQDWDQAELALLNLSRLSPRPLYAIYTERIGRCRKLPVDAGWDGVWVFENK
jgi:adenylate cyclase